MFQLGGPFTLGEKHSESLTILFTQGEILTMLFTPLIILGEKYGGNEKAG